MEKNKLFPNEVLEYVKNECNGLNSYQTTDKVNNYFNTDYSQPQIARMRKRYNIPSGCDTRFKKGGISWNKDKRIQPNPNSVATQFKKGHISPNYKQVGTISIRKDKVCGYVQYIKVSNDKWQLLNRYVWEKETGEKLKSNEIVAFKDGNPLNCDISNLKKITNNQHAIMNKYKLRTSDPNAFDTSLKVADLIAKRTEMKKNRN